MGELKLLKRDRNYKQGYFYPFNKDKLLGNHDYVIYRSALELKYYRILDNNPNVVKWGSEEIVVPYRFNNAWHRYYIDLVVFLKMGDEIKKLLIELKPYKQTQPPKDSPRKKRKTYLYDCKMWAMNQAKWDAAKMLAEKAGCEFKILTEKEIN